MGNSPSQEELERDRKEAVNAAVKLSDAKAQERMDAMKREHEEKMVRMQASIAEDRRKADAEREEHLLAITQKFEAATEAQIKAIREHHETQILQQAEMRKRLETDRDNAIAAALKSADANSKAQLAAINENHEKQLKMIVENQQKERIRLDTERDKARALQAAEGKSREQMDLIKTHHEQQLSLITLSNTEERKRLDEQFKKETKAIKDQVAKDQQRYEARINALQANEVKAKKKIEDIMNQMKAPIRDREAKVQFVNDKAIRINQTDHLLLIGTKGSGKSTFLYLLGKGEEPKQTYTDGTVKIVHVPGYMDTIGLVGWSPEDVAKLIVLLIYKGIPKDLLIFSNDRIDLPVTTLGLLGINCPMIVMLSGDFWAKVNDPDEEITLVRREDGVMEVQPPNRKKKLYALQAYDDIKFLGLGLPVTHLDDIETFVRLRREAGKNPFNYLTERLGSTLQVGMENDSTMEMIFRFVYLYERNYKNTEDGELRFMNRASLREFEALSVR